VRVGLGKERQRTTNLATLALLFRYQDAMRLCSGNNREPKRAEYCNKTITNLLFLNCNWHFWQFQKKTVSEWCLIKVLPHILFEKRIYILAFENGQPGEPALCQLYRHTFVPSIESKLP